MRVHDQLITARRGGLLRAAVRSRWAWVSRWPPLAASPPDTHTGSVPGWYARALRLGVRRSRPAGVPAGAPPDATALLLADPAITGEQERRRLCRELHDGLGPALAGLALGLDAAWALSAGQPELQRLLGGLKAETQRAVTDLRRVVYGLRPSALDELGLAEALREHIGRLACETPALAVRLDAPGKALASLPAVVEVACYRIVTEALANVARHAHATRCTVRIHRDHGVYVDVRDDGVGLAAGWRVGVGIASMRERVGELGGHLVIESARPRGTRIAARLPVWGQP